MVPDRTPQVVRFDIGALKCAIALESVREVQRMVAITPLPGAPTAVEGVVDVRGEIVPVVDLGARLGAPDRPLRASQFLVLVWTGARRVGLRVDRVHWLADLNPDDVIEATRIARGDAIIAGIVRTPDGLFLLQDPEALLRQAEAEALDEALAATRAADE